MAKKVNNQNTRATNTNRKKYLDMGNDRVSQWIKKRREMRSNSQKYQMMMGLVSPAENMSGQTPRK